MTDDRAALGAEYKRQLSELIRCPVCLSRPTGHVSMCEVGHHMCGECQEKMQQQECPVCKLEMLEDTRNFAVENLSTILPGLNAFLVLPPPQPQPQPKQLLSKCRIGLCEVEVRAHRMYSHLFSKHRENLTWFNLGDLRNFDCRYNYSMLYNDALKEKDGAVFFFTRQIEVTGYMTMELRIASGSKEDQYKQYKYAISLHVPFDQPASITFNGTCSLNEGESTFLQRLTPKKFEHYYKNQKGKKRDEIQEERMVDRFRLSVLIEAQ